MIHKFKFINTFELDYINNSITISGVEKLLYRMNGCEKYRSTNPIQVEMSIEMFLKFAKVCILSEDSYNDDIDLSKYGIQYQRLSFDYHVFRYKNLAMQRGEIYFMYEVLTRRLSPDKFLKVFLWPNDLCPQSCKKIAILSKNGYVFLCDVHMLNLVFFSMENAFKITFNTGKPKAGSIGFDKEVSLGKIQTIKVPKSSFYPWFEIRYRDMLFGMPVRDWEELKRLMSDYLLGIFDN